MNMKTLTETSTFRVLSLLLCFCFFIPAMNVSASSLQADKFKVSGIVKDATGEPVIGASVVEKGTTNGTVTDLDGNFNLSVASNSTIVISFIGYSDKELLFPYWGVWLCIMKNGMTQLLLISRCKVWDTRLIRVMPNCLLKVEKLLLKSFLQSVMKDRV